ncbi:hypothetical protein AOU00_05795 [Paenibacillus polymyxa]|nr:hypothetical protein AOU00_05795 [Paenibacillus polymyxa]KYG96481.1 hypothetical protein AZE31_22245 [Paenibacillus polymyxa]
MWGWERRSVTWFCGQGQAGKCASQGRKAQDEARILLGKVVMLPEAIAKPIEELSKVLNEGW